MNQLEENLNENNKNNIKNKSFQIKTILKENFFDNNLLDKIKIIKENIYVYRKDNMIIKVYNCITFKKISNLKLPFIPKLLEITEKKTIVLFSDNKIYFYKINLKKNELKFMVYFIGYHFCYLEKRKEILFFTENIFIKEPLGMARTDLLGNITFYNKTKPEICTEFITPKNINIKNLSFNNFHFSGLDGFNNDKYIINISGYSEKNSMYYNYINNINIEFNISIYNTEKLNTLFSEDYNIDLRYKKITDNLFKKLKDDQKLFYYNINKNTINYIKSDYDGDYYYLNDNMFAVVSISKLYIINISKNYLTYEIKLNFTENSFFPRNLFYFSLDGNEYLYIYDEEHNKHNYSIDYRMIYGLIK